MREDIIRKYLICPACRHDGLAVTVFQKTPDGNILHGAIECVICSQWYRLEDSVAELLIPTLRDDCVQEAFLRRFADRWRPINGKRRPRSTPRSDKRHKLDQKQFFDGEAIRYETTMTQLPFWKAFDAVFLSVATPNGPRNGILVEMGGGTGRMSLPLCNRFDMVLSVDLSEAMVRYALNKRDSISPRPDHVFYLVGDVENSPIRSGTADWAILSGILHHVESPDLVLTELSRVLKPGARFAGNENNRSAFRFIFDLLMRLHKLWNEKAHEEHFVMSRTELLHALRQNL
jgi:ubiquinone/menaquinone biosynthesis C-methylase UbiE/uncharacterized protein YbaR (Trm112 family)